MRFAAVLVCFALPLLAAVSALHPRPEYSQYASFARWLVHESDYAIVSTHHGSEVFGNVASVSDGEGYEHSTGIVYTYLPDLDATYQDLVADDRVALTFTEKALAGGASGGCLHHTAENPPCARLTISGRLSKVPTEHKKVALRYLFARHPEMHSWGKMHKFQPFWLARENVTDMFLINMFGGAVHPSVEEYLAAPWFRNETASGWICGSCGHAYDPARDGSGVPFEDLPDDWSCPICGAPKTAYTKRQLPDSNATWVHV